MKTKEELLKDCMQTVYFGNDSRENLQTENCLRSLVEVLADIRDILANQKKDAN